MSVPAGDSFGRGDSRLVIAIGAGDRHALEELYLRYRQRLAAFLSRFTYCHENIDEIINDTFMVVWRNANHFRWASQVSSWIFGIARRMALKSIRRQRAHAATLFDDTPQEQAADSVLEIEIQDWVMHGLNCLSDEQRQAMELAYYMGHSFKEIANLTGAPLGTVKARMFHARKHLRQHLLTLGGGI
jgi:RNA polymerase sigma-70 factor (ECF subfamily)